jgi:hypothetical protein
MDNPNDGAATVESAAGLAKASRSDSSVNPATTYAATLVVVLAGLAGAYVIGRRRGAGRRERIVNAVSTNRATISDWFRPKWKHSDPAVRRAAVAHLADQPALAHIAKNDKDSEVRKAALARVTEQYDLADVAKNSLDSEVRKAAVERVADQLALADIANNDMDSEVRKAAVERVTIERLLADIAKSGLDSEVRKAAIARVTDERLLADIAKNSLDSEVRRAVVERLADQPALADVAKNDRDPNVRKAAVARVTDENLLADIAKKGLGAFATGMALRIHTDSMQVRMPPDCVARLGNAFLLRTADQIKTAGPGVSRQIESDVCMGLGYYGEMAKEWMRHRDITRISPRAWHLDGPERKAVEEKFDLWLHGFGSAMCAWIDCNLSQVKYSERLLSAIETAAADMPKHSISLYHLHRAEATILEARRSRPRVFP